MTPFPPYQYVDAMYNYLTSGVKHLRYTYHKIPQSKVRIYYPVLNHKQVVSMRKDFLPIDGKETLFMRMKNNGEPYANWTFFTKCYDIQGVDAIDTSIESDYFVFIIGKEAGLIKLTDSYYNKKLLDSDAVFNIQKEVLGSVGKELTDTNGYTNKYRVKITPSQISYYKDETVPFDIFYNKMLNYPFTAEDLFMDVIKQVHLKDLDEVLKSIEDRYTNSYLRHNPETSKSPKEIRKEWRSYTYKAFCNVKFDSIEEEVLRQGVLDYCLSITPLITNNPNTKQTIFTSITSHFYQNIGSDFAKELYKVLVNRGCIDGIITSEDDFIFFMNGSGNAPHHPMKWLQKKVLLAYFVQLLCSSNPDWQTTSKIFEDVSANSLAVAYGKKTISSVNESKAKDIIKEAQINLQKSTATH